MKTTSVSLTVWMAQVLMTCSLHSTTNAHLRTTTPQMTTSQDVPTTDRTQTVMEPSGPVPGYETRKGSENTSTTTSIQNTITGPEVVTVSLNSTSVATKYDSSETGSVPGLRLRQHTHTTGPSEDVQVDPAVQTTRNAESSSTTASTLTWKDRTMATHRHELFTSTVPPVVHTEVSREYDETTLQSLHLESTQNTQEPRVSTTDVGTTSETSQKTAGTTEGQRTAPTTDVINTTRSEDTTRGGITGASADLHDVTNSTTRIETTEDEGQTGTSVNPNNMTNSPGTQSPTSTDASYFWTPTTTTSENISRPDPTTSPWPNCSNNERSSSKLICFVVLWSLGMIASIFLGLTVFLWVRLSAVKQRARRKGRRDKAGQRTKGREDLWAESSAEERVEFWYADGTAPEENKKGAKRQNGRKTKRRDSEDSWIQPKVTLQDITDFWRVRNVDVDSP